MILRLVAAIACAAVLWSRAPIVGAQATTSLPPELTSAIARYAALTSYADTGTIVREAPGLVDTAKSRTYFRRQTRDLYLELHAVNSVNPGTRFTIDMSATRSILWMFKGEMQAYNFLSRGHERISAEGGGQVRALQTKSREMQGISLLIPSLLYSQARLPGTISQIERATVAGIENVDHRRCHKLVGEAAAYYPSGQRTDIRPVTVWIDVETQLIRKVFEDTPKGYPEHSYQRATITLQPQANPVLDEAKFQFTVPK